MMKTSKTSLTQILFEKSELSTPKQLNVFSAPTYSLFQLHGNTLLLVNSAELLKYSQGSESEVPYEKIAAGMVQLRETETDECFGAMQVAFVAGNPLYPGAGSTMYALASKVFDTPLTSDRAHSSSPAAKKAWAKIEQSPEWTMIGAELDNYVRVTDQNGAYKSFVDYQGHFPSRSVKDLGPSGAKTPDSSIDDCPIPTKKKTNISKWDVPKVADLLGSANAYKYKGPVDAKGMLAYGKKLGDYVGNGLKNLMPGMELGAFLEVCAGVLFEQAQENGWFSR